MVDLGWLHARAFDGFDRGDGSKFLSGEVAQLAAVAAHGRARSVDDCDFGSCFRHTRIGRMNSPGANRQVYQREQVAANGATGLEGYEGPVSSPRPSTPSAFSPFLSFPFRPVTNAGRGFEMLGNPSADPRRSAQAKSGG